MKAFAWRSGQIKVAEIVPEGAIEIASGPDDILRTAILRTCRVAYDSETCLVPGVPEAVDGHAAVDALLDYQKRLEKTLSRMLAEVQPATEVVH
jgi:hypothetical protein